MGVRLVGSLVALFLFSCSTTPNTVSNVAPDVDFSSYSTYGFFSPLATDGRDYESIVSSFLKVAMAQEMDKRGFAYSDSPELLINFYINTRERIRTRQVPMTQSYYRYRDFEWS